MNEDLEIKQLLMNVGNDNSDRDKFIEELNCRLEAVEDIKEYHDYQVRKSRTTAIVAFVIGGFLGALFIAVLLVKPISSPHIALLLDSPVYVFLMSYKTLFLVSVGLTAIVAGLLPLRIYKY